MLPLEFFTNQVTLRDYQVECLSSINEKIEEESKKRLLCVLPTGTGKTVVFSQFLASRPGRSIVLAHRDELLAQAGHKLDSAGCYDHGVVKAERNDLDHQIILGSVDTLANESRIAQLPRFSTIIVDEAHHAVSDRWTKVLGRLGAFDVNGPVTLGFTATPNRTDKIGLGKIFPEIAYEVTLPEMVAKGYLANLRAVQVSMDIKFGDLKSAGNKDWAAKELSAVMRASGAEKLIAQSVVKYVSGRRLLIFTPTVDLAYDVAKTLEQHGIKAGALDGGSSDEKRNLVLKRFENGDFSVLVNCALFTEGYDMGAIDAVMIARPTKSQLLYTQMVGRGTRIHPGKKECLVIDLVGATQDNRLVTLADLVGVDKNKLAKDGLKDAMASALKGTLHPGSLLSIAAVRMSAKMVDMFASRDLVWHQTNGSNSWSLAVPGLVVHIMPQDAELKKYRVVSDMSGKVKDIAKDVDLGWAQGIAEDLIRDSSTGKMARKDAAWRSAEPTQKQLEWLERSGIAFRKGMTKGEISDLISQRSTNASLEKIAPTLATNKQLWRLAHEGIEIPDGLTKREASKMIAELMEERSKGVRRITQHV